MFVVFLWLPAHSRITGNELVDKKAQSITTSSK